MADLDDRNDDLDFDRWLDVYRQHKLANSRAALRGFADVVAEETRGPSGTRVRLVVKLASISGVVAVSLAIAGFVTFNSTLRQAANLRHRLESLREISGLDRAVTVDFQVSQPNMAKLTVDFNPDLVRSMKGFENAYITRPGYAIEYDYFDPRDLKPTLETNQMDSLFFAGQINGTTGYEEAAAQGLLAGVNAALKAQQKDQWYPRRDEDADRRAP